MRLEPNPTPGATQKTADKKQKARLVRASLFGIASAIQLETRSFFSRILCVRRPSVLDRALGAAEASALRAAIEIFRHGASRGTLAWLPNGSCGSLLVQRIGTCG